MTDPLQQARELIMSFSTSQDAQEKIDLLKHASSLELQKALEEYFATAEGLAYKGNVQAISIMLRVLDHFQNFSHDRMLLHYIAQAAANNALEELKTETHPHHTDMIQTLSLISAAFDDADKIQDKTATT